MTTTLEAPLTLPATAHELGRRGEELACRHLERQGLIVLSRNWRCKIGELDIVATDGDQLVICEVKTRSTAQFGSGLEAVDHKKLDQMRKITLRWLSTFRVGWVPLRFDVIAVDWPSDGEVRLRHLRGV